MAEVSREELERHSAWVAAQGFSEAQESVRKALTGRGYYGHVTVKFNIGDGLCKTYEVTNHSIGK